LFYDLPVVMANSKSELGQLLSSIRFLIMIPVARKMEEWTAKYKSWRNFCYFESYHKRVNELLLTVDSMPFKKWMNVCLIFFNQKNHVINQEDTIHNTHQEIAYDLGTVQGSYFEAFKKIRKKLG